MTNTYLMIKTRIFTLPVYTDFNTAKLSVEAAMDIK